MDWLGFALVLLPVWVYLLGVVIAARAFARRRAAIPSTQPPVSVLKPLHGDEPGLRENLRSFVDQDYPAVQTVFGVRNPADEALSAARAVIAERPGGDIALVIDTGARGSNLKVANLENMLPVAKHDFLVMADSDMRVGRDYLATVTAPLHDPRVGLVTCLYKGVPTGGLWSELGALHINYGFLPSALVGEALGAGRGCFGATIALRREVLDRIGGLPRCATSWPTITELAPPCVAAGSPQSCRPISSRTGSRSRALPICGGTSCVGRARCGRWRRSDSPARH